VPKFRPHRGPARRPSERQYTLEEVSAGSPERQASAEPESRDMPSKRASAPVSRIPDKNDREKSPDECVVLLPKEQPPMSSDSNDGDKLLHSSSVKARGKLQRQDESVV